MSPKEVGFLLGLAFIGAILGSMAGAGYYVYWADAKAQAYYGIPGALGKGAFGGAIAAFAVAIASALWFWAVDSLCDVLFSDGFIEDLKLPLWRLNQKWELVRDGVRLVEVMLVGSCLVGAVMVMLCVIVGLSDNPQWFVLVPFTGVIGSIAAIFICPILWGAFWTILVLILNSCSFAKSKLLHWRHNIHPQTVQEPQPQLDPVQPTGEAAPPRVSRFSKVRGATGRFLRRELAIMWDTIGWGNGRGSASSTNTGLRQEDARQ